MKKTDKTKTSSNKKNSSVAKTPIAKSYLLLLFIFTFAFIVRILYLYDSNDNPTFDTPIVDSLTYDQIARKIIEDETLPKDLFWQAPFYPSFLSAIYSLSNYSILTVKIIQSIIGAIVCVLVYQLGCKVFGKSTAIIAAIILSLYMPLIFFEAELLATGFASFWSVVLLLLLLNANSKPTTVTCFALGFCACFSIVTRPVFVPFIFAACIWLFFTWIRKPIKTRKILSSIVAACAGFLIIAVPVAILSRNLTGRLTIMPRSGGINFYIGNNPDYKQTITTRPGIAWRKLTDLPHRHGITNENMAQKFFFEKTLDYLANQPFDFLKGLAYKTTQFLSSREIPRNLDIYLFRKWSAVLKAGVWKANGFGFPFGILLPLAFVGAVFNYKKIPAHLWLFIILYPAAVIIVFVTARYRIPIIPLAGILAAAGCKAIYNFTKTKQLTKLSIAVSIIFATTLVSTIPGPFHAEKLNFEPEFYYCLGDSLNDHNHPKDAITAYSEAIRMRPDYVEAHHNIGLIFAEQDNHQKAISHYRIALQTDQENAGIHEDLGRALIQQENIKEGIEHYHKAIEIEPEKASLYDNLGTAFFKLGQYEEAEKNYSKAIQLDPDDSIAHNNLGNILAIQGKHQPAIEHYKLSLVYRADDPETLNNLANALAGLQKYEEAVENYEKAIKLVPKDTGFRCNLAHCLQQQGLINLAINQYKKVLEINPNHHQAKKALKRLTQQILQ